MGDWLHVQGEGPVALMIHGSGTDRGSWMMQIGRLTKLLRVAIYDRRGTVGRPLAPGETPTIEDHADDAAAILAGLGGGPALVVGASLGAIVALELALRRPAVVAGLILCEPPLTPGEAPPAPIAHGCELAARAALGGGPAAAADFLGDVLGEAALASLHPNLRARALATWPLIRADARALAHWGRRWADLAALAHPTLLVGGDRSPARFGDALDVLELVLPRARRVTIAGAGHAMQSDQPDAFDRAVADHARRCGIIA